MLFRKTHFQIKVIKSGKCHNLGPVQIPWRNFRGNRFSYFSNILFTSRTWQNSHVEALCSGKNLCSWENQWRKKFLGNKKKKKRGNKKKERVTFCQEKKKILCERDWYWRSSTSASDQISYHDWATNETSFSIEPDCDIFDRCERLIFSYYTDKNCPYRSELQFWSQINITLYEIGFALRRFFMKTIMKISNGKIFSDPKI